MRHKLSRNSTSTQKNSRNPEKKMNVFALN